MPSSTSTSPVSYEEYVASRMTIPSTFEEYVGLYVGGDSEARQRLMEERGADLREMFDRESLGARTHPAPGEMPPCPSWCSWPAGHGYESTDDLDLAAGLVTLMRFHTTEHNGSDVAYLSQEETLRGGKVTLHDVMVCVRSGDLAGVEEVTAAEARRRAAEMLAVVELLERIQAQPVQRPLAR